MATVGPGGRPDRILLVDDHPVVRRGLRELLSTAFPGVTIQEASTGARAVGFVSSEDWSLMLLDLSLPDYSGLEVLRRVRALRPTMPVLMLSMHAADRFERRAIAAGATGYVMKNADDDELIAAVASHVRAEPPVPSPPKDDPSRGAALTHHALSKREFTTLCLIGRGRTISEIAAELGLSVKTVSTYRARTLAKMKMQTTAELMHYAIRHGLVE
jgi:DNA-binding NarL/FixJ family response regulator